MQRRIAGTAAALAVGSLMLMAAVHAQTPQKHFEGAGPEPCYEPTSGGTGAAYPCPPAPRAIAIRAGRLFDSKSVKMLTNQVVAIMGDKITDVVPAAQVKIP